MFTEQFPFSTDKQCYLYHILNIYLDLFLHYILGHYVVYFNICLFIIYYLIRLGLITLLHNFCGHYCFLIFPYEFSIRLSSSKIIFKVFWSSIILNVYIKLREIDIFIMNHSQKRCFHLFKSVLYPSLTFKNVLYTILHISYLSLIFCYFVGLGSFSLWYFERNLFL